MHGRDQLVLVTRLLFENCTVGYLHGSLLDRCRLTRMQCQYSYCKCWWRSQHRRDKAAVTVLLQNVVSRPIALCQWHTYQNSTPKTGTVNRHENRALSYSLSKTVIIKIRYQIACQRNNPETRTGFLSRVSTVTRDIGIAIPSVCLSVCLSDIGTNTTVDVSSNFHRDSCNRFPHCCIVCEI